MTFADAIRAQRDNAKAIVDGLTDAFKTYGATWELEDQEDCVTAVKNALAIYGRIAGRDNKLPGDVDSRAVFPQLREDPESYLRALQTGRRAIARQVEDTAGDVVKGMAPTMNIVGNMLLTIFDCQLKLTSIRLGQDKAHEATPEPDPSRLEKAIQNVKSGNGEKVQV